VPLSNLYEVICLRNFKKKMLALSLSLSLSMGVVAPPARAQSAPAVPAISNPVSHSGK